MKIEQFVSCYKVSKTIRFKAIPVGATKENINKKKILEADEEKARNYKVAKKLIDRYHKAFIERILRKVELKNLDRYRNLFANSNRSEAEELKLEQMEDSYRKEISKAFTTDKEFGDLFKKCIIEETLPAFLDNEDEISVIKSFNKFSTAFVGYHENRKNMYTDEKKSTAIANRIVTDNLPRFVSNVVIFDKIKDILDADTIKRINHTILDNQYRVEDFFTMDFFNLVLTQTGIDRYNYVIGGLFTEDGVKVQGINECINLYNQQTKSKMPALKPLYKQILSDRDSASFYIDEIDDDQELISLLTSIFDEASKINTTIGAIGDLFSNLDAYDMSGIYVNNGPAITSISKDVYGEWNVIWDNWCMNYDTQSTSKNKNSEKYFDNRKKEYKSIKSFSLDDLQKFSKEDTNLCDEIKRTVREKTDTYYDNYDAVSNMLKELTSQGELSRDRHVKIIKDSLDSIKAIENYILPLLGTGKESDRDELFYGQLIGCVDDLREIDNAYNKIRNYLTKKPYSLYKYKLYFENPQLLSGWDRSKERDYRSAMLRKDGMYYVAIIDKSDSKCLMDIEPSSGENYEKLNYKLLPGPNKMLPKVFFSKKGREIFSPSAEIDRIYSEGTFKKEKFIKEDCEKIIDFYKEAIHQHSEWNDAFQFTFMDSVDYEDISHFYRDVERQGYAVSFDLISKEEVDKLVDEGKVYLFKLYNKDFSDKSHGVPNLHTMYFNALFDDKNTDSIRLNGNAEMFMRPASLDIRDVAVHEANKPIHNKNMDNAKKTTTLPYSVYKDKRFTEDQYEIHIPITINTIPSNPIITNNQVRDELVKDDNPYVIGIDRGERNLLYIVVIDGKGNIVEQFSLNEIVNRYNDIQIKTDYHKLLDTKEKERKTSRQEWQQINNIKELKEGYISQVVHIICELVEKYDAVIGMEDLNSGFKNSRIKVEKQVYQKFEKMLTSKLNYMVNKKKPIDEGGGVLKGYQLTNEMRQLSKRGVQDGFIFYIPAWLTSKIDPTTGFVDLLRPKYSNIDNAREFFGRFLSISYDADKGMFAFELDYSDFPRTDSDYRKKWKIYTNGERIRCYRNPDKNNEYDYEIYNLTDEMKKLLSDYSIDYSKQELKDIICGVDDATFFRKLTEVLRLTLQMRNSISGEADIDYLISPVLNCEGTFYCSNDYKGDRSSACPIDADANGAYNIARKVLWAINRFKEAQQDDLYRTKISISNKEWLEYAQTHSCLTGAESGR